jgi:hypothetical protein
VASLPLRADAQVGYPVPCSPPAVVDQQLRDYGLYLYSACAGNPYDSAVWVDVSFLYMTTVDSSVSRRCPADGTYTVDQYDWADATICVGDDGPYANTDVWVDVHAQIDPLKNL